MRSDLHREYTERYHIPFMSCVKKGKVWCLWLNNYLIIWRLWVNIQRPRRAPCRWGYPCGGRGASAKLMARQGCSAAANGAPSRRRRAEEAAGARRPCGLTGALPPPPSTAASGDIGGARATPGESDSGWPTVASSGMTWVRVWVGVGVRIRVGVSRWGLRVGVRVRLPRGRQ